MAKPKPRHELRVVVDGGKIWVNSESWALGPGPLDEQIASCVLASLPEPDRAIKVVLSRGCEEADDRRLAAMLNEPPQFLVAKAAFAVG